MNYYLEDIAKYIQANPELGDYTVLLNRYSPASTSETPNYICLVERASAPVRAEQPIAEVNFTVILNNTSAKTGQEDSSKLFAYLQNKKGKLVADGDPNYFKYVQCVNRPRPLQLDQNRNLIYESTWSAYFLDKTIETIYS